MSIKLVVLGYEKSITIGKILHHLHEFNSSKITNQLIHNIHKEFIDLMISYYQTTPVLETLPHAVTLAALKYPGIKIGIIN
jgi:hypothetical protein